MSQYNEDTTHAPPVSSTSSLPNDDEKLMAVLIYVTSIFCTHYRTPFNLVNQT